MTARNFVQFPGVDFETISTDPVFCCPPVVFEHALTTGNFEVSIGGHLIVPRRGGLQLQWMWDSLDNSLPPNPGDPLAGRRGLSMGTKPPEQVSPSDGTATGMLIYAYPAALIGNCPLPSGVWMSCTVFSLDGQAVAVNNQNIIGKEVS